MRHVRHCHGLPDFHCGTFRCYLLKRRFTGPRGRPGFCYIDKDLIQSKVLREKCNGEPRWIEKDVYNYLAKIGGERRNFDAADLLKILKDQKDGDDDFKYDFEVLEGGRLKHVFWMFSSLRHLYQRYHDVVVFDTTYHTNRYKMPCGIFSGVNNHLQTIPFAGCLLHDEKRETFDWVFRAFLKAGGNLVLYLRTKTSG